ncbi:aromatic-ring-hydroxylating dioxygenase subunit beta [Brevundimonas sp. BAL450]|uniref:aromatic-ring-hydroxylating dioxygenase subunit beta n=1 Tax=Brevundimonas sp. BAL450 TaxID=1708162 RepID=UPI0018CB7233|nr:aromatic-ring-hydroxylating dioxygenase subunit beta [Brevundimonas sp. BAL450]MBG7614717.1 aromatic-ring-hydroxylating dioxygenase subunit beta [Brevundimonas sp. BAL450]
MSGVLTSEQAASLLYAEGLALDERRWEDWLALYCEDARFWVPSWKNETETTTDPDSQLSLIYYDNRAGLEDRIWRLKSGLSVASNPLRRTAHMLSNIVVQTDEGDESVVKASGVVHVYDPRRKAATVFFGLYEYRLRREGDWLIAAKTVRLLNDNIPAVLDIYML